MEIQQQLELERDRTSQAELTLEQEWQRAERLAQRLRGMGIDE